MRWELVQSKGWFGFGQNTAKVNDWGIDVGVTIAMWLG